MVGLVARTAVGLVLGAAGVLKLVEGPAWTRQAADMDVPRPVAVALPYVEVAVAVPLIAQWFRPWPAVAALVLMAGFTLVVARRIADGSRPPCGCFGARSTRPLGAYHVVRNVLLTVLAGIAVVAA